MSWMMDGFTHWRKLYLLLSTTCDEIFSWMVEFWIENRLVSDNILQHCKSIMPQEFYKE